MYAACYTYYISKLSECKLGEVILKFSFVIHFFTNTLDAYPHNQIPTQEMGEDVYD